ncbi:putative DMBT1-like protein [Rhynchonycteris naso]
MGCSALLLWPLLFPVVTLHEAGWPPLQLVNGSSRCSGRVEVFYHGQWGRVCDDQWDVNDAEVVCRQLNCGRALAAPVEAQFGGGEGGFLLDNVGCTGRESLLGQCPHAGWSLHNCGPGEDASVICSAETEYLKPALAAEVSPSRPDENAEDSLRMPQGDGNSATILSAFPYDSSPRCRLSSTPSCDYGAGSTTSTLNFRHPRRREPPDCIVR